MTTNSAAARLFLLVVALYGVDSLATVNALTFRAKSTATSSFSTTTTTSLSARQPQSGDWTDDTKSSRYNSDVTDYLPPWRNHDGMKDFNNDVAKHFSGSQASPKKAAPFSSFSDATPQENVSPLLVPGKKFPRGGESTPNNNNSGTTLLHNIKWPLRNDPPGPSPEFPLLVTRIAVTILSTISTWYLHIFNGYSPVLASSATTLLVSMCLDRRSILVTMVLYHALGAFLTIFLRESSDDSGAADPVRASSVIGLLGALFVKDPTAVLALYGGSFVGMSLPSRLMYGNAPGKPKPSKLQSALPLFGSFTAAGAIAGLIHAVTIHSGYWSGGWGGKSGLCAFAGCWAYRGIGNAVEFVKQKK